MRVNRLLVLCAVAVVLSWLAVSASAGFLNVQNASFESPALGSSGTYSTALPNWTSVSGGTIGNLWPDATHWGGQLANGDGTHVYGWVAMTSSAKKNAITQDLVQTDKVTPITYVAGTYNLDMRLARRAGEDLNYHSTDTMSIGLFKAGDDIYTATPLALTTVNSLADLSTTAFTNCSATVALASGNAAIGSQIKVAFLEQAVDYQVSGTVDDVRLTYTAAPEPCSLVLMATGLLGLLCYAWRKRK